MRLALALVVVALSAAPALAERRAPAPYHPTLKPYDPPGERALELGSALSTAGYEKLRKAATWTAGKPRTDYYFDGFDGRGFVIKKSGVDLKCRVKRKAKGPYWQISRFTSKDRVKVGALSIKVHFTETWEGKLKGDEGEAFMRATDTFFDLLPMGGKPLRAAAQAVDERFRAMSKARDLPGMPALTDALKGDPNLFVPTKRTPNKQRLEAVLPGYAKAEIRLQLGREDERDAKGKPITVYELEAEPDKLLSPADAKQAAQVLGAWMLKAGLTAADQEAPYTPGWAYTAQQLVK